MRASTQELKDGKMMENGVCRCLQNKDKGAIRYEEMRGNTRKIWDKAVRVSSLSLGSRLLRVVSWKASSVLGSAIVNGNEPYPIRGQAESSCNLFWSHKIKLQRAHLDSGSSCLAQRCREQMVKLKASNCYVLYLNLIERRGKNCWGWICGTNMPQFAQCLPVPFPFLMSFFRGPGMTATLTTPEEPAMRSDFEPESQGA